MRSTRRRVILVPLLAVGIVAALSGCSTLELHGYLPGFIAGQPPDTNQTQRVSDLWVGSWITLLGVGIVTWAIILWFAIVYQIGRAHV